MMALTFKLPLASALLALSAFAASAESDLTVDIKGKDRDTTIYNHQSQTDMIARGDGGVLDARIAHSQGVEIYDLGGGTSTSIDLDHVQNVAVYGGLCPDGMSHVSVSETNIADDLIIPRCQYE